MSSPEQKAQLQPVHRIYLGELFVFIVFFAGAMSVLVGPLAVPVVTAGITIGAAVMLSAFCFLWLAFTTPMRKAEPRYAFMVLSLLPSVFICGGVLEYQELMPWDRPDIQCIRIHLVELERAGPNYVTLAGTHPVGPAAQIFAGEVAAMEEELAVMGFVENGFITGETKAFVAQNQKTVRDVSVETSLCYEVNDAANPGRYWFRVAVVNYDRERTKPYSESEKNFLRLLGADLKARWLKNLDARIKAAKNAPKVSE